MLSKCWIEPITVWSSITFTCVIDTSITLWKENLVKSHKLYCLEKINKIFRINFEILRFNMAFWGPWQNFKISANFGPKKRVKNWGESGVKKNSPILAWACFLWKCLKIFITDFTKYDSRTKLISFTQQLACFASIYDEHILNIKFCGLLSTLVNMWMETPWKETYEIKHQSQIPQTSGSKAHVLHAQESFAVYCQRWSTCGWRHHEKKHVKLNTRVKSLKPQFLKAHFLLAQETKLFAKNALYRLKSRRKLVFNSIVLEIDFY